MVKRKPGEQPGNKNAAGHRGRNGYSAGREQVMTAARTRALKPGARGVTISGDVRGVEVRAHITSRPARESYTGVRLTTGRRH